jgi:hypothetical protein
MPHFKCAPCRARFAPAATPAGGRCPLCGSPVERVNHLEEIVGFRAVEPAWIHVAEAVEMRLPEPDRGPRRD